MALVKLHKLSELPFLPLEREACKAFPRRGHKDNPEHAAVTVPRRTPGTPGCSAPDGPSVLHGSSSLFLQGGVCPQSAPTPKLSSASKMSPWGLGRTTSGQPQKLPSASTSRDPPTTWQSSVGPDGRLQSLVFRKHVIASSWNAFPAPLQLLALCHPLGIRMSPPPGGPPGPPG